jgi:hypothetical protein
MHAGAPQFFILEGRELVPVDGLAWSTWFETHGAAWHVDIDVLDGSPTGVRVVVWTRFVGFDLSCGRSARPMLFETTIHGGRLGGETRRYATWIEAKAGHVVLLGEARRALEHHADELRGAHAPEEGTPRP